MQPVKISTGFPSAAKAAKELGVSKKVAKDLSLLAERSLKTGEFVLPGVGRLVRVRSKRATGKSPAKRIVKFRVVKSVKDAVASRSKK